MSEPRAPFGLAAILDAPGPGAVWRALNVALDAARAAGRQADVDAPAGTPRERFLVAAQAAVEQLEAAALAAADGAEGGLTP
jgi:hypothetical protein